MQTQHSEASLASAEPSNLVNWDALEQTRRIVDMVPVDPGMDFYREEVSDALMTIFGAAFALGRTCTTEDVVLLLNKAGAIEEVEDALAAKHPASPELRRLRRWLDRFRVCVDSADGDPPRVRVDIEKLRQNLGGIPRKIEACSMP